jgi:hypothetical protein
MELCSSSDGSEANFNGDSGLSTEKLSYNLATDDNQPVTADCPANQLLTKLQMTKKNQFHVSNGSQNKCGLSTSFGTAKKASL